ncbi:MAG: hypothetical protein A3K19_21880 [Lentisphaerae bacterium RIFOXYB12_FULL_65_16]|nr:MAG: hypothetical protein A3K18_04370 [Lentisphaerae bacterium RIFOXYA12_64_32]OGV93908.1 MAG: hypothetical protein A3K19_21880 [Lentisphaerae bacterium RIFOXYB12_FULL_65_16]
MPSLLLIQAVAGAAENVVTGSTVTASISAGAPGAKYGPQDAVDDTPGTWWAAANTPPQWLEIRLPAPRTIDTLVVESADNPALYTHPEHLVISFSDGTTIDQEFPDDRGPVLVRFPARQTESIRVSVTGVHDAAKTYLGLANVAAFSDPEKQVRVSVPRTRGWRKPDLSAKARREHPCVYVTPADVQAARARVQTEAWAKAHAAGVVAAANKALERPDDWYLQMRPGKDACFAYGFTGCPICKASWGTWGGARCSWDNPGHVTCAGGHVLPDAEHPDPGTGYKNPDGRIHYMVGSWNAWVVEKFLDMAGSLAVAYSLTGDAKYADRAGFILDTLADIYPSCDKGSWDYPSNPPSGRLDRPWYQVARVLVPLVDAYDQVCGDAAQDKPSVTAGLSRRQNIEENMFKNGAWYCYEQSLHGGLNNGEADYIRGALAVGCLLGIEYYVRWAYDGPYGIQALVRNNVCRDGRYYETSVGYADHTRELYLTFAGPLWNYRSAKYPDGINVYDDPVFRSFYLMPASSISCLGHSPRFGDWSPDVVRLLPPKVPAEPLDEHFAEVLYARSVSPEARTDFGRLLLYLCHGDVTKARATAPNRDWLLFHAAPPPQGDSALPPWLDQRLNATNFFGQKGLAILRTPNSRAAQAALVRFGPSLNHGHRDDLNLNYFALGYELTYDLGYGLGSTHTQVGWSHQTASHNLVLVDETSQGASDADGSGGSLFLIAGLPGLQVVDCAAEATYASLGVKDYRRVCALIGQGPDTYLLDIFHVRGGKQHDYIFHSLSTNVDFDGVQFGDPAPGSLAGPDIAWGDKQGNDADIIGYPNKPYWNPPPGNGLGFLMAPQRAQAGGPFSATWHIGGEDCHVKMALLPEPGTELITAQAPGIYPEKQGAYGNTLGLPSARYVLARRKADADLESTYVAVYEPYARPLPSGRVDYEELARVATCTAGEIKPVPSVYVLLFKATGPGDEMRLPLNVATKGRYTLSAAVYGSPKYGEAQASLDGTAFEKLLNEGQVVNAGKSQVFVLGARDLEPGPHTLTLKVVTPIEADYWIGLQYVALSRDNGGPAPDQPTRPFLKTATRLTTSAGATAVRVEHVSGRVDHLLYTPQPGPEIACGDGPALTSNGCVARVSTRDGKTTDVDLVGGSRLNTPDLQVQMAPDSFSGTLTGVDYARCTVSTSVRLPADGRLNGAVVYFGNPSYSRNTAYRIAGVSSGPDGSVIDLGRTSLTLGFADLADEPQDEHTLTTLNPHEYSRALRRPDSRFFHGKLLATADGKVQTTIHATTFGQPFVIKVESTRDLHKGMRVFYYDIRPGDSFRILNTCSLQTAEDGTARLTGTADVTLRAGGEPVAVLQGGITAPRKTDNIPWQPGGCQVRLTR